MDRSYLKSAVNVARWSRILAKGIDLFLVLILSLCFYPLGVILSCFYLSVSDALQQGQSIGKKFMGFGVISLEDGKPCSVKQSFIRNLPFLIPILFSVIPIWGWIFTFALGALLMPLEFYFLFKLDSGHRLGDVMADTSVMAHDGTAEAIKRRQDSWFPTKKSSPIQRELQRKFRTTRKKKKVISLYKPTVKMSWFERGDFETSNCSRYI
jgi:uncharacterized RDD family membrane protein YckC